MNEQEEYKKFKFKPIVYMKNKYGGVYVDSTYILYKTEEACAKYIYSCIDAYMKDKDPKDFRTESCNNNRMIKIIYKDSTIMCFIMHVLQYLDDNTFDYRGFRVSKYSYKGVVSCILRETNTFVTYKQNALAATDFIDYYISALERNMPVEKQ